MIELLSLIMSLFDAKFYDFNVHPAPDTHESITKLAFEAKRYGYSGIALIDSAINQETIPRPENFSIYSGHEISCKPSKFRDEIKKHKEKTAILIARGGDEEFTRAAVATERLDILLQPVRFNHVLAKIAGDNLVTLGFNIGSIIRLRGEARIRELTIMRRNLKYARKYDLQMLLTSNSCSCYDLRSPREMAALAGLFGMTANEAVDAMSDAPLKILKRKKPDYIQEGIEIV